MIKLNRGTAPLCLSDTATNAERDWAFEHYSGMQPAKGIFTGFKHYNTYEIKRDLLSMSHMKCAYCETKISMGFLEVEHYRPKGNVDDLTHSGYWWLALEWSNLLPSCPPCNKRLRQHIVTAEMTVQQIRDLELNRPAKSYGKFDKFPVRNKRLTPPDNDHFSEGALLIDPTRMDPKPELKWRSDIRYSVVEASDIQGGQSDMGKETIVCLALNRVELVRLRTEVLDELRIQSIRVVEDIAKITRVGATQQEIDFALGSAKRTIADMWRSAEPTKPFSAMARAFIEDLATQVESRCASGLGA
ncbi:HNH endonuclease family protein [Glutamicibacter protophormiae]|uniref:hypothetical protein n=1 Tax=Glutamicibacter protophormiae TaxID=37930 RepID=UPI00195ECF5B|nr:hypothetical protein [Glutamicibacter protophormiae]QRQ78327.1 hypothetical protein JQN66_15705 [Glutamicibacter protophormiae]